MIHHTVAFRLAEDASVCSTDRFLSHCRALRDIPGVREFRVLRQIGRKSAFTHALSMLFDNQMTYDAYDAHPDHQQFVKEIWIPNVADFHELDYMDINESR